MGKTVNVFIWDRHILRLRVNISCPSLLYIRAIHVTHTVFHPFFLDSIYPSKLCFTVTDKFGTDRYLFQGQCVDSCPEAHFHTQQKTCEACPEQCQLCSSASRCLKCSPPYYLNHGVCTRLECGEGQGLFPALSFLVSNSLQCDTGASDDVGG